MSLFMGGGDVRKMMIPVTLTDVRTDPGWRGTAWQASLREALASHEVGRAAPTEVPDTLAAEVLTIDHPVRARNPLTRRHKKGEAEGVPSASPARQGWLRTCFSRATPIR
jgi:hypothetical protein